VRPVRSTLDKADVFALLRENQKENRLHRLRQPTTTAQKYERWSGVRVVLGPTQPRCLLSM